MPHIPVLQKEILEYLDPKSNENFIDATIGGGGHALEILKKNGPAGKLLGIDLDQTAIDNLASSAEFKQYKDRLILICDNFANLEKIVKENNFGPTHGIIADLGLSSDELELSGKGFSFLKDEPLDMRYHAYQEIRNQKFYPEPSRRAEIRNTLTAEEIVNKCNEKDLTDIFWQYGEERFSRKIARKIVEWRKITPIISTFQLVEIIRQATPAWYHHKRIHPATKIFQALRIAVNNELDNLAKFLPPAFEILVKDGRSAIISFHSLEDRIVKNFLKQKQQEDLIKILTKKPIRPSFEEIGDNPRSRSARLRAASKI